MGYPLLLTKVFYVAYILWFPLLVTANSPGGKSDWHLYHTLSHRVYPCAIIFQPAHVIEGTSYPVLDENRGLENNWAVHQLLTTTNFGNGSRWLSCYV